MGILLALVLHLGFIFAKKLKRCFTFVMNTLQNIKAYTKMVYLGINLCKKD